MQSRYHYLIFGTLGLFVLFAIYLSFKYVNNPKTSIVDATEAPTMDDTTHMLNIPSSGISWLGQMNKETHQKSYFYAVSELQLKLN
jgi:hypothetical protein